VKDYSNIKAPFGYKPKGAFLKEIICPQVVQSTGELFEKHSSVPEVP